jgi:hypothetical protein
VLIATIVRARRAGVRAAACAVVAAGFVAIKLSPPAAHALEYALTLAHLQWRIWSDATDLIALAALPVAWWLTGWRVRPTPALPAGAARRAFERASVIAGALACLATSYDGPYVTHDLTLVNRTRATRGVAFYFTDSPLDCPAVDAGELASLATATFFVDRCISLEPGKTASFGSIVSFTAEASPSAPAAPGCKAVVIRAEGLTDTVLTWPQSALVSDELASQVFLEEAGGNLYVAGTDYVHAASAAFTLPASGCMGLP